MPAVEPGDRHPAGAAAVEAAGPADRCGEIGDIAGTGEQFGGIGEHLGNPAAGERGHRGLAALTPIQREALTLAYFGGLTQSQVAQRLGLPLGTVKTRIRDGLSSLRTALGVHA